MIYFRCHRKGIVFRERRTTELAIRINQARSSHAGPEWVGNYIHTHTHWLHTLCRFPHDAYLSRKARNQIGQKSNTRSSVLKGHYSN